jgi:microcystin-dependent protein
MAEPFIGEIRVMSFGFPPTGWASCNGQLLPINQNQALFSLLGTSFGGDGRVNFGLPDLQGRTPIHVGSGHALGERGGEPAHTLSTSELPQHTHAVAASSSSTGGSATPNGNYLGGGDNVYLAADGGTHTTMSPETVTNIGGSQPHLNMQPFLTLNFCVALQGIFPSQT